VIGGGTLSATPMRGAAGIDELATPEGEQGGWGVRELNRTERKEMEELREKLQEAEQRCPTLKSYILHSTLYTLHSTLYTLHSTLYTLPSTLYTLHSTLYTLRSTLYTLHSTLYTLHSTELHSTHQIMLCT
jgi:hypothetical protein